MPRSLLVGLLLTAAASAGLAAPARYEPNWASLDTRPLPAWYNEAKFGVFIVWGPYSVPAWKDRGYAEWYGSDMRQPGSPTAKFHERVYGKDVKYEDFAPMLRAEMWDPDAWADLFVRAGARYVVTTANYHDGFAMYPTRHAHTTQTDQWNSMVVGPKRDILGELKAAGEKRGLKMGIYYSLYEWFHPLWQTDRDRFVTEQLHPKFKEVVARYAPWFIFLDGEWEMDFKRWRTEELAAWLYNESPCGAYVVTNDRWGQCRGAHGDVFSSEYGGGNLPPDHPWQEDRGMGRSYGYNRAETIDDYDSASDLIRMLVKCAAGGGNYLLCVGPTADGRIPVIMQERLLEIGAWLKANGEAVYGAQASPFWPRRMPWGAVTAKPGRLFACVYGQPTGPVRLPGLRSPVAAAYVLADPGKSPVPTRRTEDGVEVDLPPALPAEAVHVVALEIEGKPAIDRAIRQQADGSIVLRAAEADIHGPTPQYESGGGKDNIGWWGDPKDSVRWTLRVEKPGEFDVEVTYSCAAGAGGSEFVVSVAGQDLAGKTKETGAWNRFAPQPLGRVRLEKAGEYTLRVQPRAEPKWRSMGLQKIVLAPAK